MIPLLWGNADVAGGAAVWSSAPPTVSEVLANPDASTSQGMVIALCAGGLEVMAEAEALVWDGDQLEASEDVLAVVDPRRRLVAVRTADGALVRVTTPELVLELPTTRRCSR